MQFTVSEQAKKEIVRKLAGSRKSVRITKAVEKVMLAGVLGGVVFILWNCFMPGAFEGRVRGTVQKNYFLIFMFGSIIIGCFFTLWLFAYAVKLKLSNMGISDRVSESLSVEDGVLIYAYRPKYQSMPDDRGIVALSLNEMREIVYQEREKKLVFRGKMSEQWIPNFRGTVRMDISDKKEGELALYDYFMPSLLKELENERVNIRYEA